MIKRICTQLMNLLRSPIRSIKNLNAADKEWCIVCHPLRWWLCWKAYRHATCARKSTKKLFGENGHNNAADAYRHCYWSARMTLDMGAEHAKGFGDRHEDVPYHKQPATEQDMDLTNNRHGRKIGQMVSTYEEASARCYAWSKNGTLQTSPHDAGR